MILFILYFFAFSFPFCFAPSSGPKGANKLTVPNAAFLRNTSLGHTPRGCTPVHTDWNIFSPFFCTIAIPTHPWGHTHTHICLASLSCPYTHMRGRHPIPNPIPTHSHPLIVVSPLPSPPWGPTPLYSGWLTGFLTNIALSQIARQSDRAESSMSRKHVTGPYNPMMSTMHIHAHTVFFYTHFHQFFLHNFCSNVPHLPGRTYTCTYLSFLSCTYTPARIPTDPSAPSQIFSLLSRISPGFPALATSRTTCSPPSNGPPHRSPNPTACRTVSSESRHPSRASHSKRFWGHSCVFFVQYFQQYQTSPKNTPSWNISCSRVSPLDSIFSPF